MRETKRIIRSNPNYLKIQTLEDEQLQKMCFGKTRYNTIDLAQEKIQEINGDREVKLRAYTCPICTGWHLTSKN